MITVKYLYQIILSTHVMVHKNSTMHFNDIVCKKMWSFYFDLSVLNTLQTTDRVIIILDWILQAAPFQNMAHFPSATAQGLVQLGKTSYHDDVIKWKHFPRYWPFVRGIHRSPVNSPHKVQWRGALMFSLICVGIIGWISNREVIWDATAPIMTSL